MNPATINDVESRWRPLSPVESTVASTRLDDGWRDLRRELPDLEQRVAQSADLAATAAQIIADAVIRLMKNPDGYRKGSLSIDDASRTWEYDTGRLIGELFFSESDLAKLSASPASSTRRAFSIVPS